MGVEFHRGTVMPRHRGIRSARLFAESAKIPHHTKAATDLWLPQISLRFPRLPGFHCLHGLPGRQAVRSMLLLSLESPAEAAALRGSHTHYGGDSGPSQAFADRLSRLARSRLSCKSKSPKKLMGRHNASRSHGVFVHRHLKVARSTSPNSASGFVAHHPARARAWRRPLSAGPRFDRPRVLVPHHRDRHGPIAVAQSPSGRERRLLSEPRQAPRA